MPIPADYFTPDATGSRQSERDIGELKALIHRLADIHNDIIVGVTRSGEPLTNAQKINVRSRYAQWRKEASEAFARLPEP